VPASSAVDTDRDEEEESDYDEEDEVSPRKLRSGKVIMPNEQDDEEEEEEDEETAGEDEDAEVAGETDYMEEDEEAVEDGEASVDDEVDLSEETVKTLTRYRRDELVRLCESRNLDVEGTKPQLAKALLEWVRFNLPLPDVTSLMNSLPARCSSTIFIRSIHRTRTLYRAPYETEGPIAGFGTPRPSPRDTTTYTSTL
jgi:hypothetical protein